MYFAIVVLFLLVCPSMSVAIEASSTHQPLWSMGLIGRWWVFWAVGIRLFIAGVKQTVQPRFTAEEIFGIRDAKVFPVVREVGFANLAMGAVAVGSFFRPAWVVPAALVGGLYYGFAALGHLPRKQKNAKEYAALISDAFASAILLSVAVADLR